MPRFLSAAFACLAVTIASAMAATTHPGIFVQEGSYYIVNVATGTVLDQWGKGASQGTPILGVSSNSGTNQQWTVKNLMGGWTIQSVYTGQYASSHQYFDEDQYGLPRLQISNSSELFALLPGTVDNQYYIASNNLKGRVLDLENASPADGTNVVFQTLNQPLTLNQQWAFNNV